MNETTINEDAPRRPAGATNVHEVVALVVAWFLDEPSRVGEVLLVPATPRESRFVFGRGPGTPEDPHPRLYLSRHRPGRHDPSPPVTSPRISRVHLHLRAENDDALEVDNVGRAPMLHNGAPATTARVIPGDTLQLGGQLLLLAVRRPSSLPGEVAVEHPFGEADRDGLVGESAAAWALRSRIAFVASRSNHTLILGASGTGKELVANAIHAHSERADKLIVSRNAATFPEGLIDAELFGNAKNFPNPGMVERPGLVGQADGSTLFLDEFAELPAGMQAHLLRVLDGGEYQRLGESTARRAKFRLVAATNRSVSSLKHDVLARFGFRVEMPDLNARKEDVPLILRHLMRKVAAEDAEVVRHFFDGDPAAAPRLPCSFVRSLLHHTYTTHVRELSNLLWAALAAHIEGTQELSDSAAFDVAVLSRSDQPAGMPSEPLPEGAPVVGAAALAPAGRGTSAAEIQACLDRHNGVVEKAWRELGLSSRYALTRLIEKHGLEIRKRPRR